MYRPIHSLQKTVLAALLALSLGLAEGAAAQVVGRVTDLAAETPVQAAGVALIDAEGNVKAQAVTDADGLFSARITEPGVYTIQIVALGYVASSGTTVNYDEERVFLEIDLVPAPIEAEGITVSVEQRVPYLEVFGFYDRRDDGRGTFLTPEDIQRRKATRSSHLLREVASVLLSEAREPVFARAIGTTPGQGLCVPNIYVDGYPLRTDTQMQNVFSSPMRFDLVVPPPEQVAAMEVYPGGASIPPQWRTATSGCGVIVVWSRRW